MKSGQNVFVYSTDERKKPNKYHPYLSSTLHFICFIEREPVTGQEPALWVFCRVKVELFEISRWISISIFNISTMLLLFNDQNCLSMIKKLFKRKLL